MKAPEVYFSEGQIAALVTISIIIVLNSISPRDAFYVIAGVAAAFFLINYTSALLSRFIKNMDQ